MPQRLRNRPPSAIAITTRISSGRGASATENGTLLIQGIFPSGLNSQQLTVVGTISGIAVVNGVVHNVSNQPFSTVATLTTDAAPNAVTAQQQTSCSILHLDLGPISLNVLGLMVTTNEIVVNITAIPNGPSGGLLGSLLCALANALSTGSDLTALLNQLNALLSSVLTVLAL